MRREIISLSKKDLAEYRKERRANLDKNIKKKMEAKARKQYEEDNRIFSTDNPIKEPKTIEKRVIEAKKELINKVIENEVKTEIAIEIAEEAANAIEAAVFSIDDIMDHHKDWMDLYEEESGKKAIWKNAITNGFKEWLMQNGFH